MNAKEYTKFLSRRLVQNFDFMDTTEFRLFAVDLFAVHRLKSEKFFFTKKVNLYRIQNDEYILAKELLKEVSVQEIAYYCDKLTAHLPDMLHVTSEHMSSIVSLVLISESAISSEVKTFVEKKKYHKDFMFTLRGWADFALIVIDLEKEEIYNNKFAKQVIKNYEWRHELI